MGAHLFLCLDAWHTGRLHTFRSSMCSVSDMLVKGSCSQGNNCEGLLQVPISSTIPCL